MRRPPFPPRPWRQKRGNSLTRHITNGPSPRKIGPFHPPPISFNVVHLTAQACSTHADISSAACLPRLFTAAGRDPASAALRSGKEFDRLATRDRPLSLLCAGQGVSPHVPDLPRALHLPCLRTPLRLRPPPHPLPLPQMPRHEPHRQPLPQPRTIPPATVSKLRSNPSGPIRRRIFLPRRVPHVLPRILAEEEGISRRSHRKALAQTSP